jgi:hypothetical protein
MLILFSIANESINWKIVALSTYWSTFLQQ